MPVPRDPKTGKVNTFKGVDGNKRDHVPLTPRQQAVVTEYVKTGKKMASYKVAYSPKNPDVAANKFFKNPKVQDALAKALKASKFDDQFATDTLKKIVDGGMANIDITRPDTALKALETYFKITNKIGGGNKIAIKMDFEAQAKKMDLNELTASIRELDKKQKRILQVLKGTVVEEGEVIE